MGSGPGAGAAYAFGTGASVGGALVVDDLGNILICKLIQFLNSLSALSMYVNCSNSYRLLYIAFTCFTWDVNIGLRRQM